MSEQKRPAPLLAGLMLCCLLTMTLPVPAQNGQSGQKTILFTLYDKKGKSVSTPLRKEDVRVIEDGVPQEVESVESRADQPLSLVMMLDTSISQERALVNAKIAAKEFLNAVVRPGMDSVGVVSFTGEMKVAQEMTDDVAVLRSAIDGINIVIPQDYPAGVYRTSGKISKNDPALILGSTAIWDSVIFVCEKILSHAPIARRRAILLFSDGMDTSSRSKLSSAIDAALKEGVVVYSMVISDASYGSEEGTLAKLSERTGGRAVSPKDIDALRESLAQMGCGLRAPYALSFSPSNKNRDLSLRKIKIELINPELRKQGLRLSYQQGYFAR